MDRRPIDWRALLSRVHAPRDRALVQNLHLIDRLRRAEARTAEPREAECTPSWSVRLLAALTAVQAAGCLGALAFAFAAGDAAAAHASRALLASAFGAAAVLLGAATRRDARCLYLFAAFAAVAGAFGRAAVAHLPAAYTAPIAPLLQGIYPEAFTPAFVWQFALVYPRVRRFTPFDRLARRSALVAWRLGTLLFAINLAPAYGLAAVGHASYFLRNHPRNLFWSLFALAIVPALATVLVRARRAKETDRRRLARFAWALVAGTAPVLFCGLARLAVPRFDEWFLTAGPDERGWLDRLIVVSLMSTPVLGALSLVLDRPFEFHAILPPASRVRLARAAVTGAAAVPFGILAAALYHQRAQALTQLFSGTRGVWLLACLSAGCALLLSRARLLDALERRARGEVLDHRERLVRALDRVRTARGAREIGRVLEREVRSGVGTPKVRILLPADGGHFVDPSCDVPPVGAGAALTAMLRDAAGPLDLSSEGPLLALLPHEDRDWLLAHNVELAAALRRGDGTLAALVLCGAKRQARPFTREDVWLVSALTASAAAAWDAGDPSAVRGGFAAPDIVPAAADQAALECRRCGMVAEARPLPCRCGAEPTLAALPRHLAGKFTVQRRLGAGAMGVVYLARDATLDRDVALKTLPNLHERAVARLRDEARAMAGLNHESLATLYGLELWRRTPVLVVEYFPAGTLAHRLAAGPLPRSAAVSLGIRLARALVYMHGRGMLHRDIKPSNIALTGAGRPRLLDFGLAALGGPAAEEACGWIAGTPAYMPPEAFRGAAASEAFDLWALSVVIAEAVGGRHPFLPEAFPERPRALAGFFERALARDPARRFQTALELLTALEAAAGRVSHTFPS